MDIQIMLLLSICVFFCNWSDLSKEFLHYSEREVMFPTLFHFHYTAVSHPHQQPDDPPCEVVVQISSDGSIC